MSENTAVCRDPAALLPAAQKACALFLAVCAQRGIQVFLTETYRSQARQNALYAQGRTQPGAIVTWTKNSLHTSRLAWDIAVSPPLPLYDASTLAAAGQVGQDLGIVWGGGWSPPDRPHFQVTADWRCPMTTSEAIALLAQKEILVTPQYWENACQCVKFLPELLCNMAEALGK